MADRGRPSSYDPEIAAEILDRLAAGETLRSICRSDGMPSDMSVRRWAAEDRDGFSSRYAKARDEGMHVMADEIVEIADSPSGDVQRDRLRVDTRKWLLSKIVPKVYGDKTMVSGDPEGAPIKASLEVAFIRPKADAGPAD